MTERNDAELLARLDTMISCPVLVRGDSLAISAALCDAAAAIRALIAERDAAVARGFTAARQRAEAIVQRFVADPVYAASAAPEAIATEIHLMRPEGAMDA